MKLYIKIQKYRNFPYLFVHSPLSELNLISISQKYILTKWIKIIHLGWSLHQTLCNHIAWRTKLYGNVYVIRLGWDIYLIVLHDMRHTLYFTFVLHNRTKKIYILYNSFINVTIFITRNSADLYLIGEYLTTIYTYEITRYMYSPYYLWL